MDWIFGKISGRVFKEKLGEVCPEKWLIPWRHLKIMWMWHLRRWFNGGLGSIRLMAVANDLEGLFQIYLNDSKK